MMYIDNKIHMWVSLFPLNYGMNLNDIAILFSLNDSSIFEKKIVVPNETDIEECYSFVYIFEHL